MLVTAVLRAGRVVAIATAVCVVVTSLASVTLWDGILRNSKHISSSLGVERGGSPVILLAIGEQQTRPRRLSALAGTASTLNNCAVNNASDEDTVQAFDDTTLSLGNWAARVLTGTSRAGGEEGTWYKDTLATLLVEYCEEEQQSVHHR